ncbi:GNAT family N-acetyltransferase [Pseudomonas sp. F1_0610]|uniref:GNAT family N-acetyltransferase n=1 Tax=Pseudomonas sp. F1_0610 TaxID=3114284 RepID=UPI0039C13C70
MQVKQVLPEQAPIELLLIADPNLEKVQGYLAKSLCWVVEENQQCLGVAAALPIAEHTYELMNIAIAENQQQKGIGALLLKAVIADIKALGATELELGTGTFGHQLSFYQRHGFRVDRIEKNFFLDNYPEPIWENGIQHQDMLRLVLRFN